MTWSTNNQPVAIDVYKIVEKGKPCVKLFTGESLNDVIRRLRDNYGVEIRSINISSILQGLYPSYNGFTFTKAGSPVPIYDPMKTSLKIARLDKATMEVLEIYESISHATSWLVEHEYTNSKSTSRGQNCRGKRFKTMYNFVWRFVDDNGKIIPLE